MSEETLRVKATATRDHDGIYGSASALQADDTGRRLLPDRQLDLGQPGWLGLRREWVILFQVVVVLLLLDFLVLRKVKSSVRNHVALTVFWLSIGMLYNVHIWYLYGADQAIYWFSGFSLEWMLSMDNLVVFSLIMTTYRVPPSLTRKALFVGIVGCVLMRLGFFLILEDVLKHEKILQVGMGVVLMASGGQAMFEEDSEGEIVDTYVVRATKACLGNRLEERYDTEEHRLFVYRDGKYKATLLVFVIILLEITDLMFALDSVSAKIAAVPNQFIAYSSTVMAVFSLRAAFFIVHDLVQQIEALKYGVAFIVAYIGVQLILSTFRYVPEWSLIVDGLVPSKVA
ncbi:unnamed protein product [Symbiodinium natans]|uniref:Uncharacterized protein n=1 Tax=Symbiodinium natans TaxID=878477 RepID=A0A812J6X8_9DINO|nr:unnamed protein product [Symbiodinium natans]